MNWVTRHMKMSDMPSLLSWYNNEELHYTANAKSFKPYTLDELVTYWEEKLNRPNADYYLILVDGKAAGRVSLKKKNEYVEYAILIGDESLYSKGLGTEITKYFVDKVFAKHRAPSMVLEVRKDNGRAIRCYEKSGFTITKEFRENGIPMYEMKVEKSKIVNKCT
ncbi:GNAT family N-acetyltransferase [Neobacillus cucumis]|uniref:GNAT family N-acetyltransferase n=1 Tax=Neobacillus cucumis TaxID=1740721 RepID=UPI001964F410|nr:GNAT family N-acetyltransferase [Neobacillus cucumis]MBM7654551.1 RimJ/RimL family protein N-acetyltransferase [Neobacillus cucumis]